MVAKKKILDARNKERAFKQQPAQKLIFFIKKPVLG